jgi:serine/threonine protein phosphatase PrpC
MRAGGFARAYVGLPVCGDAFLIHTVNDSLLVAVADGLGHGEESAAASQVAMEVLQEVADLPVGEVMERCHQELRSTRGAALGLLKVDREGKGEFCGVGNIEIHALRGRSPSLFCMAGIVGHNVRKIRVMNVTMEPQDIYCMISDGVSGREDLSACLPGPPATVAQRIVERWGRLHDDATALVVGFHSADALLDGSRLQESEPTVDI